MRNLFLASSFADVADVFEHSEDNLSSGKTVTFIPTASIYEEVNFYVGLGKQALEQMGLIVDVLEISTASNDEIVQTLRKNHYIYVTGGNTFFLLQELKRSNADQEIIKQIELGKTYIGESAGSMVLSPSVEYVKEMDDFSAAKELSSYEALSVIDFYPLPHYTNEPFQEVTEKIISMYTGKIHLRPFSNTQAIRIKGDDVIDYDTSCSIA